MRQISVSDGKGGQTTRDRRAVQVIDGLRYDTEKATMVCEAEDYRLKRDSMTGNSSWQGWSEALYQTKSGRFFLFGFGTEGTRWDRLTPMGADGAIQAITEEEARAWVERYCSGDVFTKLWPEAVKDA